MIKLSQILCLIILVALAGVTGCKDREPAIEIPFETIENADLAGTGGYYEEEKPKLVIITETEQIDDKLGDTVSSKSQVQLRDMDFDRYFVIGVFQGRRPYLYTVSGVEIQRIEKGGNAITIFVHFYEPVEDQARGMVTSPYHLLRIQKGESLQGEFKFILKADGKSVARQTHFIP
jgi:hypothetical protein